MRPLLFNLPTFIFPHVIMQVVFIDQSFPSFKYLFFIVVPKNASIKLIPKVWTTLEQVVLMLQSIWLRWEVYNPWVTSDVIEEISLAIATSWFVNMDTRLGENAAVHIHRLRSCKGEGGSDCHARCYSWIMHFSPQSKCFEILRPHLHFMVQG